MQSILREIRLSVGLGCQPYTSYLVFMIQPLTADLIGLSQFEKNLRKLNPNLEVFAVLFTALGEFFVVYRLKTKRRGNNWQKRKIS